MSHYKPFHKTLLQYRSSRHTMTGYSPAQLMIQRSFRLPLTIIQLPVQFPTHTGHENIQDLAIAGPSEQGGPGRLWPTHCSKKGLPPTGVWRKLPENGIRD